MGTGGVVDYANAGFVTQSEAEGYEPMECRLNQIWRSHKSARPNPGNPAWTNTHNDLDYVLNITVGLLTALEELVTRCDGAEGVRADGSNIQTMQAHAAIAKTTK